MITLSPAATRPIRITVPAKRGIVVEKVNANLPAPAIRLLSGPAGTVPGPKGEAERVETKTGFGTGVADFMLDFLPANPAAVRMLINGTVYRSPESFTMAGQHISWLSEFTIEDSDQIEFRYP